MRYLITKVGFASSTAAKYSNGAALQRSVGTPNAALTCSTSVDYTPTLPLVVRDEDAAGSNPVTPTVFPQVRGPQQKW